VRGAGFPEVEVRTVLSPAWTTDWMTDRGRRALADYGIAPPQPRTSTTGPVVVSLSVRCPQCGSGDTRELSRFGSTACKSMWACNSCLEPFDHFKAF
jgi:ring-1,2-phenylacetyl-CoA epoxidase subunit PaaD